MIKVSEVWDFDPDRTIDDLKVCEEQLRDMTQGWKAGVCKDAELTIKYLKTLMDSVQDTCGPVTSSLIVLAATEKFMKENKKDL